jgi:protein-L-isoaspartate(D-aspartate) O-methyltransferase
MCGCRVTALEEDKTLFGFARRVLGEIAPGVTLVDGPLGMGCASGAPYDIVFIEGAVSHIPPELGSQLRNDGGRLVGVMCGSGRASQAVLAEPTALGLRTRVMFDCGTPPFPSLMPAPVFEF